MENIFTLPQHTARVPMQCTTFRMSLSQYEQLNRLTEGTGSPSSASALRLLIETEHRAMADRKISPNDFTQSNDGHICSLTVKLSAENKQHLQELTSFYGAKSNTLTVCYIISKYAGIMNSGKAVR